MALAFRNVLLNCRRLAGEQSLWREKGKRVMVSPAALRVVSARRLDAAIAIWVACRHPSRGPGQPQPTGMLVLRRPPSTFNTVPCAYEERPTARYVIASAISSGVAARPAGDRTGLAR